MKIKKFIPFLLALLIFIISNFIQRNLSSEKKKDEARIATIEKDLTAFLQYISLSTADFNFAQLYLTGVWESTITGNSVMRKVYMANVSDGMARALTNLDEATTSISYDSPTYSSEIIKDMKDAEEEDLFSLFTESFTKSVERTKFLTKKINDKMQSLSDEKITLKKNIAEISSRENLTLNFTIAINFLILLFTYIEKKDKQASMHQ